MKEKLYIGILPIHGDTIVIEGRRKKEVKREMEERIKIANKTFPNFDFHPGVKIYRAKRLSFNIENV